jgi:hypothetical protein
MVKNENAREQLLHDLRELLEKAGQFPTPKGSKGSRYLSAPLGLHEGCQRYEVLGPNGEAQKGQFRTLWSGKVCVEVSPIDLREVLRKAAPKAEVPKLSDQAPQGTARQMHRGFADRQAHGASGFRVGR